MTIRVLRFIYRCLPTTLWDGLEKRTCSLRFSMLRSAIRRRSARSDSVVSDACLYYFWVLWGNRGYSAHPVFLRAIFDLIQRTSGGVVECGSGLSTLVSGILLNGSGRHWNALEHDQVWANRLQNMLKECRLTQSHVHAVPLSRYGTFEWYGNVEPVIDQGIDLIVRDGPPAATRGGRFGVLPVLGEYLADCCWVILDDTDRTSERDILNRWRDIFPHWTFSVEVDAGSWVVIRVEK